MAATGRLLFQDHDFCSGMTTLEFKRDGQAYDTATDHQEVTGYGICWHCRYLLLFQGVFRLNRPDLLIPAC
ncbi:hypothetical protein [Methylohalomonas lacus]|uniref:hypothetical protein n=1 Tax=Methylohalomonas lacus TaxID=398773 RepID=UPI002167192F|nr:hypothetical protein [Methylohalomonas lacus]